MAKLKVEVKLGQQQLERFQILVQNLIENGYDVMLMEQQSQVWIYFPEGAGFNLVIKADGRWTLE